MLARASIIQGGTIMRAHPRGFGALVAQHQRGARDHLLPCVHGTKRHRVYRPTRIKINVCSVGIEIIVMNKNAAPARSTGRAAARPRRAGAARSAELGGVW